MASTLVTPLCGDGDYTEYEDEMQFRKDIVRVKKFEDAGYTVEATPTDGTCMFHALHYLFCHPTVENEPPKRSPYLPELPEAGSPQTADGQLIREHMANFVERHQDRVLAYIGSMHNATAVDKQVSTFSRSGVSAEIFRRKYANGSRRWGTEAEAQLFAVMSDAIVCIVNKPTENQKPYVATTKYPCKPNAQGLYDGKHPYTTDELKRKSVLVLVYNAEGSLEGNHYEALRELSDAEKGAWFQDANLQQQSANAQEVTTGKGLKSATERQKENRDLQNAQKKKAKKIEPGRVPTRPSSASKRSASSSRESSPSTSPTPVRNAYEVLADKIGLATARCPFDVVSHEPRLDDATRDELYALCLRFTDRLPCKAHPIVEVVERYNENALPQARRKHETLVDGMTRRRGDEPTRSVARRVADDESVRIEDNASAIRFEVLKHCVMTAHLRLARIVLANMTAAGDSTLSDPTRRGELAKLIGDVETKIQILPAAVLGAESRVRAHQTTSQIATELLFALIDADHGEGVRDLINDRREVHPELADTPGPFETSPTLLEERMRESAGVSAVSNDGSIAPALTPLVYAIANGHVNAAFELINYANLDTYLEIAPASRRYFENVLAGAERIHVYALPALMQTTAESTTFNMKRVDGRIQQKIESSRGGVTDVMRKQRAAGSSFANAPYIFRTIGQAVGRRPVLEKSLPPPVPWRKALERATAATIRDLLKTQWSFDIVPGPVVHRLTRVPCPGTSAADAPYESDSSDSGGMRRRRKNDKYRARRSFQSFFSLRFTTTAQSTPTVLQNCLFVMTTVRTTQQFGENRVWQEATWCGTDAVRTLLEALDTARLQALNANWRNNVHALARGHWYTLLTTGRTDLPTLFEISTKQPAPPWVVSSEPLIDPALEAQAFAESGSVECD